MNESITFRKISARERITSMLAVDFIRLLRFRLFYILIAVALLVPITMTVMMAMMDGSVAVDPQTGVETVMRGPENTWQNIGTLPGGEAMGGMDVFGMCNVNMMFMAVAVFVCLFISDDFRCGYSKNLFTRRAKKGDYVISKTLFGCFVGALMLVAYFLGSLLGGAIAGLSFDLHGLTLANIVFCLLAKIFLMPVFVSIFTLISVLAKEKAWLAITGSLGGGMLLFMTVSLITPLSSGPVNLLLCLVGGAVFSVGLGFASRAALSRQRLV